MPVRSNNSTSVRDPPIGPPPGNIISLPPRVKSHLSATIDQILFYLSV
jgi:hypothetical protein